MNSLKLPVNLTWKLLARIFDDLSLESLCNDLFKQSDCNPLNSYEIIYGLTLVLLKDTFPIHKRRVSGSTPDTQYMDLDRSIRNNTLANSEVSGKVMKSNWICQEHNIFIKVLQICEANSSKSFIKSLQKYKTDIEKTFGVVFDNFNLDQAELYNFLKEEFNFDRLEINRCSLMQRNKTVYRNLCILAYLVLNSEDMNTSNSGNSLLDYSKLDCLLIQLYCVKEIWKNINNVKSLTGKKHYKFDKEMASDTGGSLRPDAVYYFDTSDIRDIVVDVKLYANSCVENAVYKYSANIYQVNAYATAYPSFRQSRRVIKPSKKVTNYMDVNAWIIHFRKDITSKERSFNGKQLFDFSPVRVYNIDLSENKGIEYLDEQIKLFVNTYLLCSRA